MLKIKVSFVNTFVIIKVIFILTFAPSINTMIILAETELRTYYVLNPCISGGGGGMQHTHT